MNKKKKTINVTTTLQCDKSVRYTIFGGLSTFYWIKQTNFLRYLDELPNDHHAYLLQENTGCVAW